MIIEDYDIFIQSTFRVISVSYNPKVTQYENRNIDYEKLPSQETKTNMCMSRVAKSN